MKGYRAVRFTGSHGDRLTLLFSLRNTYKIEREKSDNPVLS
jgi:hypothetical protein